MKTLIAILMLVASVGMTDEDVNAHSDLAHLVMDRTGSWALPFYGMKVPT